MKQKRVIKIITDVLMTAGLLFLTGYQFWGEVAHEWAGAAMFLLFILHHILNAGWYRNLFRGKYTPVRIFQIVVDLLVFAAMIGLMVSGILLSNHVFAFLDLTGGISFARLLHMASSYWGFVLMALHLGLHWGMFVGMARKTFRWRASEKVRKLLSYILSTGSAVYGLFAFLRRDMLTYMFVRTHFVFLDFNESRIRFYLDHFAMMGTFIFVAYYGSALLRKLARKEEKKDFRQNDKERRCSK